MIKSRKYVVKSRSEPLLQEHEIEIVEYDLPPLKNKQILIKTEWLSVEPYLGHPKEVIPYDIYGFQVGIVQQSTDPEYPIGTRVVSHIGWCDYSVQDTIPFKCLKNSKGAWTASSALGLYKLPDLKGLSPSLALGAVGMPGATAYFGMLKKCRPKAGETVVITAAAGSIGSIAGQIAKIKGCRVVGFAGSNEKVKYLENELGFDKAINYKTANIDMALQEAAPNGVDCFFDNVGGEITSIVTNHMNIGGRIALCGCMTAYFQDVEKLPKVTMFQHLILFKQLKMETFISWDYVEEYPKAFNEIVGWIKSGQLKVKEEVIEGFDKFYDTFINVLAGKYTGKVNVKV